MKRNRKHIRDILSVMAKVLRTEVNVIFLPFPFNKIVEISKIPMGFLRSIVGVL